MAAIIASLTLSAALPGKAHASTIACGAPPTPRSCLRLDATSTVVQRITAGVRLGPGQHAHGYFHVWAPGVNTITNSPNYWNRSPEDQTFWGPTLLTRLPDRSTVCVQFIDAQRGSRPPICASIATRD
jgi:hypothetical protein